MMTAGQMVKELTAAVEYLREENQKLRDQWKTFAGMMEPIASGSEDCLCNDPPAKDHEDESRRDPENPSCHSQYCPFYLYAYALALAEGREVPD